MWTLEVGDNLGTALIWVGTALAIAWAIRGRRR
jgi:hypothetical protein